MGAPLIHKLIQKFLWYFSLMQRIDTEIHKCNKLSLNLRRFETALYENVKEKYSI